MSAPTASSPDFNEAIDPRGGGSESAALVGVINDREDIGKKKGLVANTLEAIALSGSTDQLRGYANAALGETKLSLGLAVGSPELALMGIAQKALGEAQKYIGEAKIAGEIDAPNVEPPEAAAINSR